MEEPLLFDTDRAYDIAGSGGMGKAMEESEAKPGAETPEAFGGLENRAPERIGYS